MIKLHQVSPEVYLPDDPIVGIGREEIDFLRKQYPETAKLRSRICSHLDNHDRLHEMFIAFSGQTYLQPSLHVGKDESLHVLEGEGLYVFFDSHGNAFDSVPLGTLDSGRQFYCRINEGVEHALFIRSAEMIIHETTSGPFRREDTVFSSWAPDGSDGPRARAFAQQFIDRDSPPRKLLGMERISSEVYQATDAILSLGRREIDFLKSKVQESPRSRVRLCLHKNTEHALHEMVVVYMDQTYVRPNRHFGKDESLHILEGEADFYFFDTNGTLTDVVNLGDYHSGKNFYIRVPKDVFHTIVMKSKRLVIHETTPGPFVRSDTEWASWAPPEEGGALVDSFVRKLRECAEALPLNTRHHKL